MTVVSDSGPLIHLAIVNQFSLLEHIFKKLFIIPQVYDEVIINGEGKPGDLELRQAIKNEWIVIEQIDDLDLVKKLTKYNISETDASVIAFAIEKKVNTILADDLGVRKVADREGLSVTGSIGILAYARQNGLIHNLKTVLDNLVSAGFHLDPNGPLYRNTLKKIGESK